MGEDSASKTCDVRSEGKRIRISIELTWVKASQLYTIDETKKIIEQLKTAIMETEGIIIKDNKINE